MRINDDTSRMLDQLAAESGETKQDLLAKATLLLMQNYFLEKTNREFEELRADEKAWEDELAERAEWDAALMDGLDLLEKPTQKRKKKL